MSTLIRGHSLPLRLTIPPLRTPQGFACSVASLSRCPCHYPPGHHSLRRAALVECPLGQGKPSTQLAGHNADCCTPATTPRLGDRKAWPLPGAQPAQLKVPHLAALAAETRVGGCLASGAPRGASFPSCPRAVAGQRQHHRARARRPMLFIIGAEAPQKLRNSHCCVPFTATFSKRRKIGSL